MVKNVVLLTVDSLRADHLSSYGYHRVTTPNLDRVADRGFLFTRAFSNSSWTVPSFASMMASCYPLEHSYRYHVPPQWVMLAEVLQDHGYLTLGINCLAFLSRYFGWDRGFEVFEDFLFDDYGVRDLIGELMLGPVAAPANSRNSMARLARKVIRRVPGSNVIRGCLRPCHAKLVARSHQKRQLGQPGRLAGIVGKSASASTINDMALSWLEKRDTDRGFFLWIHYVDIHIPYAPPNDYTRRVRGDIPSARVVKALNEKLFKYKSSETPVSMSAEERQLAIDLYDAEIMQLDDSIGLFLDRMAGMGLLDDTAIIVTADHGEEFLDHGGVAHSFKLYDELLHVPLIVCIPGLGGNETVDELVSHLDLAPTVADLLGIDKPQRWRGESVLPLLKGERRAPGEGVLSEVQVTPKKRKSAYRTHKWKLIATGDGGEVVYELYDLESDPRECSSVADEYPQVVEKLGARIRQHIAAENEVRQQAEARGIREKTRRLREGGEAGLRMA